MVSARHCVPNILSKLREAKSIEFNGVWIVSFVSMNGTSRDGDKCACGNSHTIGKCERAQRETVNCNWEKAGRKSGSEPWVMGRESNVRREKPSTRWDSRRKLSTLCILSIPAFVQPSSVITASTSSRRGPIYSGFARRRYSTCMTVY